MAISQPPPSAYPDTAAITGLRARDTVPARREVIEIRIDEGFLRHLLDVGACRERLLRAGEQNAADRCITIEGIHCFIDFGHERCVERVERLRSVQTDETDTVMCLDDDVGVSHAAKPQEDDGGRASL